MKKYSSITRVNSHRTSRNKQIIRLLIVGVIVLSLLFLVPTLFASVASFVLTPIHATQTWLAESSTGIPYFFRDRSTLVEKINQLNEQIFMSSEDEDVIAVLTQENEELRDMLDVAGGQRIAAGVIGRPGQLPYDVLLLDKGSNDGVVVGAPVFVGTDTIIGIVEKIFFGSAVVELVTSPGFTTTVYIYGPDIYTNAVGIGGGIMRVGVPQGIEIAKGNMVVLPSVERGIFGKISVIESLPTKPEQYGYVSTELPLTKLRLVSVGIEPLRPVSFEEAQQTVREDYTALFTVPVPKEILIDTNATTTEATSSEDNIVDE